MIMCRRSRAGIQTGLSTGPDRQRTPSDYRRSRCPFVLWDGLEECNGLLLAVEHGHQRRGVSLAGYRSSGYGLFDVG